MATNSDDTGVMSDDAIQGALETARARLERAERERDDLERVIAATREEERLLSRLPEVVNDCETRVRRI